MKRVSIIGSRGYPFVYSGYETFVKELSERIVKKNIQVTVYCHKGLFKSRPKMINGINLIYLPSIETKFLSQFIHSLLSIIHSIFSNYDVILVLNVANGPFGVLTKIFRVPTVINVDGLEWLRPKWKGLGVIYFKVAAKMATIFYDQIITDSNEMKNIYLKLFNKKSKVIAYGANLIKTENTHLINKFNIKKGKYYLIVGRLIPDNNADLIIKGYLLSKSKKKLVIVGDVPYRDGYASKIKNIKSNNIVFTGYVNEYNVLAALYKNSYVYIHGHEFGGTNPTMIKALAFGTAILALDTIFNREMLQNDKFGLFFQKDYQSVEKLIKYCDKNTNEIHLLKSQSHLGINKKYDWDSISDKYLDVFNKLSN